MERMDNMVSHIKMQQFTFITIYINAAFVYDLEIISHLYNQVLFLVIAGKDGRDGVNGECGRQWLNVNTLSFRFSAVLCVVVKIIQDYEWYKVQTHVLKVHSVHSIHSLWKSKRLATYMQCIRNNNLEIRIAGSSCRPWLSFIQIQTCQYILANSFWVKLINAWDFCPVMTGVSENVPATSAHLQQFSEDVAKKCVKLFWQPLRDSEVISSVKGKLDRIFVILIIC